MTGFEDREKAFESKFGADEELDFRIASRTAKLFGAWAAEQLSLKGAEADSYVEKAVAMVVDKASHDHLIEKTEKDFMAKGIKISRHHLEREMSTFHAAAGAQIGK